MKNAIKYFFTMVEEDPGVISSSRVMYVLGCVYSMAMGAWVFRVTHDWTALMAVVPALAGIFVVQKIAQKSQENKAP